MFTVAVGPVAPGSDHFVPAGGVATTVLASVDDRLLAFGPSSRLRAYTHVHGAYPLGRWRFESEAATAAPVADDDQLALDPDGIAIEPGEAAAEFDDPDAVEVERVDSDVRNIAANDEHLDDVPAADGAT